MNVSIPNTYVTDLFKEFTQIEQKEYEEIKSKKEYSFGEVFTIQMPEPLSTCTHYVYAYFKLKENKK